MPWTPPPKIWGAPDDAFGTMIGDVLIAQSAPGKLGRVHWNGSALEYSELAQTASLKQIAFAPAGLAPLADAGRFYEQIALVRHGLQFNSGRIEGALWQLNPEAVTINGSAVITSDLLVPGTPNVVLNGSPNLVGTLNGLGNPQPTNYNITLNFAWTVPPTQVPIITQGWLVSPLHQDKVSDIIPITMNENIALASGTLDVCGKVSTVSPSSFTEPNGNGKQDGEVTSGPSVDNSASAFFPRIISTLDPAQLPNGKCMISLDGTTTTGEHLFSQVLVHIVGENKPGRVTLKVNKFTVPAPGFPLTITRESDSLNRSINGDFGHGWALDVYATRLEEAPDYGVTFTDPASGRRVHFDFTPQWFGGILGFLYQPAYTTRLPQL